METELISSLGRTVIGTTKVTIGRASDNMIVLSDARASSHHAEVRPEGSSYSLIDLGSMNGTFVNEQQVSSGMPRLLQPGDTLRTGDTEFTFKVSSTPQESSYFCDSTVPVVPPPPLGNAAAMPDFAGNTSYGMGHVNYSDPLNHQGMVPAQSSSLTPLQPPYVSETQLPTYVLSSYKQSGQGPSYTPPQPPNFTAPQPPQPQKRSPMRAILLAVIAFVIVLAGVGSVFIYHNNQVAQENSNATATVQTSHANATATALAKQNATATAFASTNLTATAIATSHYPPFTNVQLNDPLTGSSSAWDSSSICQFASAGYQVSLAQTNTLQYCLNTGATFGDSAYQVSMNIQQGDCGGLIFRFIDDNNFFYFTVCQNGTYNLGNYVNNHQNDLYPASHSSSAIQQGLNKPNVIAVTVQGDTVNMYVNGNHIDTATVQVLTSSTFSQGSIGLLANDTGDPTTVVYTNALVWTAS